MSLKPKAEMMVSPEPEVTSTYPFTEIIVSVRIPSINRPTAHNSD